jgi:hypothetical protein
VADRRTEFEEVFVCDDGLFAGGEVQEGDYGTDAAGYRGLWGAQMG